MSIAFHCLVLPLRSVNAGAFVAFVLSICYSGSPEFKRGPRLIALGAVCLRALLQSAVFQRAGRWAGATRWTEETLRVDSLGGEFANRSLSSEATVAPAMLALPPLSWGPSGSPSPCRAAPRKDRKRGSAWRPDGQARQSPEESVLRDPHFYQEQRGSSALAPRGRSEPDALAKGQRV